MTSPIPVALRRVRVGRPDGTALSVVIAEPASDGPLPDGSAAGDRALIDPAAGAAADAGLPPILALHGFASSAAGGWGRTGHLEALTRAGRTVIAPDLRGHGESGKPHDADAYALDTVLADIAACARELVGVQPEATPGAAATVDLIGYSLGARLAFTIASQGLWPVRRMVLGGFDGRPLFSGVDPERLERLAASGPGNDRLALRALVAGLAGTGGSSSGAPLPGQPVLVVAGTEDPLASRAAEFAARLPRGQFLAIPGRNHISAVPARAYRQATVAFLGAR